MTKREKTLNDKNNCDSISVRKKIMDELGGIPEVATVAKNDEWLYMLEEDTRHSLAIEGFFATEKEIRSILRGRKTGPEILNYFRTAQGLYDLGLQYHRENMTTFNIPLIRHIHSELFREISDIRGQFRKGPILISGTSITPPPSDLEEYVRTFVSIALYWLDHYPIVQTLSRIHTLFESIHPFEDGNGRTGRIFINFISLTRGYPPLLIKGYSEKERNIYYHALEEADKGLQDGFPSPEESQAIKDLIEKGDLSFMEKLIKESLISRLDKIIVTLFEEKTDLMDFSSMASFMDVQPATLRKWVERNKLIASLRGNKLYSHPRLFLG